MMSVRIGFIVNITAHLRLVITLRPRAIATDCSHEYRAEVVVNNPEVIAGTALDTVEGIAAAGNQIILNQNICFTPIRQPSGCN